MPPAAFPRVPHVQYVSSKQCALCGVVRGNGFVECTPLRQELWEAGLECFVDVGVLVCRDHLGRDAIPKWPDSVPGRAMSHQRPRGNRRHSIATTRGARRRGRRLRRASLIFIPSTHPGCRVRPSTELPLDPYRSKNSRGVDSIVYPRLVKGWRALVKLHQLEMHIERAARDEPRLLNFEAAAGSPEGLERLLICGGDRNKLRALLRDLFERKYAEAGPGDKKTDSGFQYTWPFKKTDCKHGYLAFCLWFKQGLAPGTIAALMDIGSESTVRRIVVHVRDRVAFVATQYDVRGSVCVPRTYVDFVALMGGKAAFDRADEAASGDCTYIRVSDVLNHHGLRHRTADHVQKHYPHVKMCKRARLPGSACAFAPHARGSRRRAPQRVHYRRHGSLLAGRQDARRAHLGGRVPERAVLDALHYAVRPQGAKVPRL